MQSAGLNLIAITAAGLLAACPPNSGSSGGAQTTAPGPSGTVSATTSATTNATSSAGPATSGSAKPAPKPYEGPTGTLRGTLKVTGDDPPQVAFQYPKECGSAVATYGKLFRVGQDGELADAIVAVTRYQGFVPPKEEAIKLTIKECAYSTRTVAMTTGQHLEVSNLDPLTSYLPHLDGARAPAAMVAVPRGDPVKLHSRGPGRYWLRDQMGRKFMVADVFHFRYSTAAVTKLDGKYVIDRLPVGKVQVSVMLPAANLLTSNQETVITEGDNTLDLSLNFDAKKDVPKPKLDDGAETKGKEAPKKTPGG
jgi:hypothetical protein